MSIQIQIRGGTTLEHIAFKGQSREITCDTDKHTVVVQDGKTLGGFPLAREDLSNVDIESIIDKGIATTSASNFTPEGLELLRDYIIGNPIGCIFSAPLESMAGYLLCDGSEISRAAYVDLFEKIGIVFGAGDGSTTFNIPDYRGCFLRAIGTNSETNFSTLQDSAAPNIEGVFDPRYSNGGRVGFTNISLATGAFKRVDGLSSGEIEVHGSSYGTVAMGFDAAQCSAAYGRKGTTEVRPRNFAVNFFIKY